MSKNFIEQLLVYESRKAQQRENSARAGTQSFTFDSIGAGSFITPEPQRFDTPFVGEPAVATGVVFKHMPNRTLYQLPVATAGVYRWTFDDRGFHTGAFLYFAVHCEVTRAGQAFIDLGELRYPPEPQLVHHVQFTGMSFKNLPGTDRLEQVLTTNTPPAVP